MDGCGVTGIFLVKVLLVINCLGLALYYDLKEQKIKNLITFPTALAGLIMNFFEQGPAGLLFSLKGWVLPILLLGLFYYINVMGAGDIKLFAATGAVMGLPFALSGFVFSVFTGGFIALFVLMKRKQLRERVKYLFNYFKVILYTGRISIYSNQDDLNSKFIFTAAIVPGTMFQLFLTIKEKL